MEGKKKVDNPHNPTKTIVSALLDFSSGGEARALGCNTIQCGNKNMFDRSGFFICCCCVVLFWTFCSALLLYVEMDDVELVGVLVRDRYRFFF